MFRGGIADKLGNRYEAKWLVRTLLDVVYGQAEWLVFEGLSEDFKGFEFSVSKNGVVEWHQTKENAPQGNWTLAALEKDGFLSAIKVRLQTSSSDRCVFVSQDNAKSLRTLTEKSKTAKTPDEFVKNLSNAQKNDFDKLHQDYWKCSKGIAFASLQRIEIRIYPNKEIEEHINSHSDLYFGCGYDTSFPALREFLERNFNTKITTESVRECIRNHDTLMLKDWSLDSTVRERLADETLAYLNTYSPFGVGGETIVRSQVKDVINALAKPEGPELILLTGVAGSGKSGVIRGVIDHLEEKEIPHLAFRVDQKLHCNTREELGNELIGRRESPVTTLKGATPDQTTVLIVDQLDAISEVSGRDGVIKEAILRMVTDAHNFKTVRLVLVCRTFDLNSDQRFKSLKNSKFAIEIGVPLLDWEKDVEPLLKDKKINIEDATDAQKQLLCLPVTLAVFLELEEEVFSFKTRADLFEKLLNKKQREIKSNRNISWSIIEPLIALANWMSNRQKLDAPIAVLDRFSSATDILTTEGLIVQSKGSVNFFHESFFDHIFARSFVTSDQTLLELLLSTEQHLFRRTQTRQIFEALRQNDKQRYIKELRETLTSEKIRYHIKLAIAQWLGALDDPNTKEFKIVSFLDMADDKFSPLCRIALLSSPGWFDYLLDSGWLASELDKKDCERKDQIFWWLSSIAGKRPEKISELLRSWWGGGQEKAKRLVDWFGYIRRKGSDDVLLELCLDVIRSNPPDLFVEDGRDRTMMLLHTWSEKNSEKSGAIIKALFDAWFALHPGRNVFQRDELKSVDMHTLGEIAKKSPEAFLLGTTMALVRAISMVVAEGKQGANWYYFNRRSYSGHRFGFDAFLGLYRSALCELATKKPKEVEKFLIQLDVTKHQTFLHLHLEVIAANPEYFEQQLVFHLSNPDLFRAGWDGAGWKSFADAAKEAFPFLNKKDRSRIETAVSDYHPELDRAKKIAHHIALEGEESEGYYSRNSAMWDLKFSGFKQLCILETIGQELLGARANCRRVVLRRKFPDFEMPKPNNCEAHWVGPPIKQENAAKMSDKQWLKAFDRYDDNEERKRGHDWVTGGARELGRVLQAETKSDPARFSSFLASIPKGAHPTYIEHILGGLAEAEDGVTERLVISAIKHAHSILDRPYGTEIARLFERCPEVAEDSELLDILLWYAEYGKVDENAQINQTEAEKEMITIEDLLAGGGHLHIRGNSGVRGWAWEAVGSVLWHVPSVIPKVWKLLEKRVKDEKLIVVRCSMVRPLSPLFNDDKHRCADMFLRLVSSHDNGQKNKGPTEPNYLAPLITYSGTELLPYILYQVPGRGKELVTMLLQSGDEAMEMIGGWHVLKESFRDETYIEQADSLIKRRVEYRRLAASLAADAIAHDGFEKRAKSLLEVFFNDEDEAVRTQAARVFGHIKSNEFARFHDLAKYYLSSRAYERESHSFFRALEEATSNVLDLVIEAAEKLVEDISENGNMAGRRSMDLHYLEDLLKREYASSESDPTARKRILDVIDITLARELYGAENIVKEHER